MVGKGEHQIAAGVDDIQDDVGKPGKKRYEIRPVPMVFLPAPHYFIAWWPWVKNYNGETRAGAAKPGPIYARVWIDQDLKKKMGY